jgi:hypothetical protein
MNPQPTSFAGVTLTSAGTAVSSPVAKDSAGLYPKFVRVAATGTGAYVRFSNSGIAAATTAYTLVQPGDALIMNVATLPFVSAISVSGTSVVTVSSLEWGGWINPLEAQIATLFTSGEQGLWLDPSDFSTMFQDSAGTTPVTAAGQSVGLIKDKSGRGNNAAQATAGNRPVLQQDGAGLYYLAFNGVSSSLSTSSVNFTATDKMTVFAGVRKNSDAAAGLLVELSAAIASNNGSFAMLAPASAAANVQYASKGTIADAATKSATAAPITVVMTGQSDIVAPLVNLRVNGVQAATSSATQGTGTYGNFPVYIGARGGSTLPFNGSIYSLIVRGSASSAAQVSSAEAYSNSKAGAF